ncbi:MAG: zinc-ribbon domain-containing protein [Eggerthellaceae bacterium]
MREPMHCKACGRELRPGATYCLKCGAPIDKAWGVASFDPDTGKARYRCGDCRRCKHRISCATKNIHQRDDA